jgi:hypothetical protein
MDVKIDLKLEYLPAKSIRQRNFILLEDSKVRQDQDDFSTPKFLLFIPNILEAQVSWGLYYKTFYCRNLQIFVIS